MSVKVSVKKEQYCSKIVPYISAPDKLKVANLQNNELSKKIFIKSACII